MRTTVVDGIEVVWRGREDWELSRNPVTGPSSNRGQIDTDIGHWPGNSPNWQPPADTASHLRWMQDLYKNDPNRGYSLGYSFVTGISPPRWQSPRRVVIDFWGVRELDIRNAANNGDFPPYEHINWNDYTTSIQVMCSEAHPINAGQEETFRLGRAVIDVELGRRRGLQGHRDSDWTKCPGNRMYSRLQALAKRPAIPTIPDEGDDMTTRIIQIEGDDATFTIGPTGKHWIPNAGRNGGDKNDPKDSPFKAGQDFLKFIGADHTVQTVSRSFMRWLPPVDGPNPDKGDMPRDAWGVPLDGKG